MLFNSYFFLFAFLPIAWAGFFLLLNKQKSECITIYLLILSLVFYGFWDWNNFYVLIPSIFFNYYIGAQIAKNQSRFLFITVHDAGHEEPTYRPKDALELFDMYINNNI